MKLKGPSKMAPFWMRLDTSWLPFADAATPELPMRRLLRLSLFQVTVGLALALMIGTLNRVMIVELRVSAALVSFMIAVPLLLAPARAIIGFRSDHHRSAFGWRRVPFIWFGTLGQFGGFAIMPFALIVLSGHVRTHIGPTIGHIGAALAFLMVGLGMHTVQTAGLALATDLAPEAARPKVVAMLSSGLLVGMIGGALIYGFLLTPFSLVRLIQVLQGTAAITMILNGVAMWKQEPRRSDAEVAALTATAGERTLRHAWMLFRTQPRAIRRLVAIGLGTLAFSMQDILLEPYGGQILHLAVGQTTALTAMLAAGAGIAFALGGKRLARGADPYRLAAFGTIIGLFAFCAVIFSSPLNLAPLFAAGVFLVGLGGGLFLLGTLSDAMGRVVGGMSGLALGAWGAVQALAAGCAIATAGLLRHLVGALAQSGAFGPAINSPAAGYLAVYEVEIVLLFITLIAIGPLVRRDEPNPMIAKTSRPTRSLTAQL
ncbi:MFS transporter, BCD family, chlorophyll transporter [Acidiphilium sp. MT5]